MTDLRDRLQAAIGDTYRMEKELGGGGMSRVFLAEEVALARRVVIKLLPPEMSAGVSVERFQREIQLAAKLQHPHIVPLLTAGSHDDLLYYVMPYIEGESLRAKLAREGELPVNEAVRILKEVLDALQYSHSHNVVHRDIKPDNVLLSGNHAVVMDFGVAKAVSASTGQSSLTSLGVALGTPAYMAPEQAAADPHVDHRADIYAVGALAYEMMTGRPPFTGNTPQAVLSAHITQAPDPVTTHRSTVPDALNELILRCLQKKAADRWQRAADLIPHLDAILTPSGGMTPTGTQPVAAMTTSAAERAVQNAHPLRVMGLFGLASVGALAIVYFLVQLIGLPDWVFYGAIGLLVVGFPIVLLTGHREKQRAFATMTGMSMATPVGLERHFTWRKSLIGGGLAFVGLAVVAGVYMTMRVMGIGPVGTLVASGVLGERERILLTDFQNRTSDSTLGPSVTNAFRVDLSQSQVIRLVDASALGGVLRRMEVDPSTPIDLKLAREIAEREGINAIVTGELGPVGRGYVLSASIVSAENGEVLTAVRETASDDGEIIGAIDKLSGKLRERIGESLRDIRANEPLDRVTTASLPALRKYSQAIRAEQQGDITWAVSLMEEATSLDTAFAMAYRKLAVILGNTSAERSRTIAATAKAFEHRDRLTEIERYLTIARYHAAVEYDRTKVMDAYRSVLAIDPDEITSLNNLAVSLNSMRRFEEAEELAVRASHLASNYTFFFNSIWAQAGQGKYDDARATIERFATLVPEHNPYLVRFRGQFAASRNDFDTAERAFTSILDRERDATWQASASLSLSNEKAMRGQLSEAERYAQLNMKVERERGVPANYLSAVTRRALIDTRIRDAPADALDKLNRALAQYPLAELPPSDRPYSVLITAFANAGETERAKRLLAEYEAEVERPLRDGDLARYGAVAAIALAEGRYREAIEGFQAWHESGDFVCAYCALYRLGHTYDLAGNADSALAVYERAVSAHNLFRMYEVPTDLPPAYKRLGELYEERGDKTKAVEYYNEFVELWSDADAELQPQVKDVRDRIARLVGER